MKILTFRMADTLHAVEISTVASIARADEVVAAEEWEGAPWLDLAAVLGYGEDRGRGGRGPVLLLRDAEGVAVVRVDGTGEVVEVPDDALRRTPSFFESHLLAGVVEREDELIVLLDGVALVGEARAAALAAGKGGA